MKYREALQERERDRQTDTKRDRDRQRERERERGRRGSHKNKIEKEHPKAGADHLKLSSILIRNSFFISMLNILDLVLLVQVFPRTPVSLNLDRHYFQIEPQNSYMWQKSMENSASTQGRSFSRRLYYTNIYRIL